MILKLAWRNIWRNRRRTLITAGSIFFAVLLSAFMDAIQQGAWDRMLDNIVNYYSGYLQIHQQGYWEEQTIDKSLDETELKALIEGKTQYTAGTVGRLESFALASFGSTTTGVLIAGTQPEAENQLSQLAARVSKGRYFSASSNSVLIAEGLGEYLALQPGDTLVLISQGYHGVNAAGKYPVAGWVHFASPDLNKQMVYMPLAAAQEFFGAPGMLTSMVIRLRQKDDLPLAEKELKNLLPSGSFEVMDWKAMMPDLLQAKAMDAAGNYVMMFILYLIIGFGIFGTILMMTRERTYEFGVLLSIGMSRWRLSTLVWIETLLLGLVGAIAGIIGALPLVYYFNKNPIDFSKMSKDVGDIYEKFGFEPIFPAVFKWTVFGWQGFIVMAITFFLALYPIWYIRRIKPVEAMHA